MSQPIFPIQEVFVRDCLSHDGVGEPPLVTLELDADGRWWHTRNGDYIRPAVGLESLLPLAPRAWERFEASS